MKQFRINASARIKSECPSVKYINTWNNQVEKLREDSENKSVAFRTPAVFVEILPNEIKTLGNGNQIYDPFDVRLHIVHRLDKSENMDENLVFEDVRQEAFAAFHKWQAPQTSGFFRINEERDYDHDNIYHCMIDFRTCYVDSTLNEPRNGTVMDAPIEIDLTVEFVDNESNL